MLIWVCLLPVLLAVAVRNEKDFRKALSNGANVELEANITLAGPWTPIVSYGGTFKGNGHVISGVTISPKVPASQGSGFFTSLDGGRIENLALVFDTVISSNLELYGGLAATVSSSTYVKNVSVNGTITVASQSTDTVTVGCVFGNATTVPGRTSKSDNIQSNCKLLVEAPRATVYAGGVIGMLNNGKDQNASYYSGQPHVSCTGKKCYVGGFTSVASGPVTEVHFTDSLVNATAKRYSVVGGLVGQGVNIQRCSLYNTILEVNSTGRSFGGASVGGIMGETRNANYIINESFAKLSLLMLNARDSSYLGGTLGYGKYSGGTIKHTYAFVQSLRGFNNGGHMYGAGFIGYGNASSLSLSTCYMFVPEFQFYEKPGAGGKSYYGGFFGFINGTATDRPKVHSLQAGMGKFEVRMMAPGANVGNFGGAITGAENTLIERIVLMGAAGIYAGVAPENAAIFIGKIGEKINLKTILVNISMGNAFGLENTANFVNTFTGTATDIVYSSGIMNTKQFVPSTGTYESFNIRIKSAEPPVQENVDTICTEYCTKHGLDTTKFNCDTSDNLNKTLPSSPPASSAPSRWKFTHLDNWKHDPVGWYLPKGVPVANSAIKNSALHMTLYIDTAKDTEPSWKESGWDNSVIWLFGRVNETDATKAVPPSFPALRSNPESFLACVPGTCERDSFFSPFLCNCLFGCPGLKNGKCTAYNKAICDKGWRDVGISLCTGFDCSTITDNDVCGGASVGQCDSATKLCKCDDKEKFYDHDSKSCRVGCQRIGQGICTGEGEALCESGWKNGNRGLCTEYSCTSDKQETACGGSSVATCDATYDVCKCTTSTSYYNQATQTCVQNGCKIANDNHICIGVNKAICMNNAWPSTVIPSFDTLCAQYDCIYHQTCADRSTCDLDTLACKCSIATQYFDTTDNKCKDGCTGLSAHAGVCIGANKALCYKGYSTPAGRSLCSKYSCAAVHPTCNGAGKCVSDNCICNDGAMLINNTCFSSVCIQGTISSDKQLCTCNSGWATDSSVVPLQCTKPSSCPTTVSISSEADLIYLYSCSDATFNLTKNVTVKYPWVPVPSFTGNFIGNNFTLRNVKLLEASGSAAMFLKLEGSANISDLHIVLATDIQSHTIKKVAGVAINLDGASLTRVSVSGTLAVTAQNSVVTIGGFSNNCAGLSNAVFNGTIDLQGYSNFTVGAFCGSATTRLFNLTAAGSIVCRTQKNCTVGGIVGATDFALSNLTSNVTITVDAKNSTVGGVVGSTTENLSNLTFGGSIDVGLNNEGVAGGIAGAFNAPATSTGSLVTVENCHVVSTKIVAPAAAGLIASLSNSALSKSLATVTTLEGSICVGGLACSAIASQIKTSGTNISTFRMASAAASITAKRYGGGFLAEASETAVEDCYAVLTDGNLHPVSEAFIGGFIGLGIDLTVVRSYVSGTTIDVTPNNILHFGGFVGEYTGTVDSSFSRIVLMRLRKSIINAAHFGGFVGLLRIKPATGSTQRTAAAIPHISRAWTNANMDLVLSDPTASRVFYGGFSGEIQAGTIDDSYVRSEISSNGDINLFHTGFGVFNGRYSSSNMQINRCYADVGVHGASDLNFEGNNAYGVGCQSCTKIVFNKDRSGTNEDSSNGRTVVEMTDEATFTSLFGSTDSFVFEPRRMPMIVTTPNVDPVTNAYVYPECDSSKQKDCWDYENVWAVSPAGLGTIATAPKCYASRCRYCDATDPNVCQICGSKTYRDGAGKCNSCHRDCITCVNKASFCVTCSEYNLTPNESGVCNPGALSGAGIAGITIAVIIVIGGCAGFLCWWFACRNKETAQSQSMMSQTLGTSINITTDTIAM